MVRLALHVPDPVAAQLLLELRRPAPGRVLPPLVHLTELRTALDQAYQAAGQTPPTYTDSAVVAGLTVIKAIHLNELRTAVRALG